MKFRTELNYIQGEGRISYTDKILCIGSCFAENLHLHLKNLKYSSFLNPCGISYNPSSILKNIKYAVGELKVKKEDIQELRGIYSHPDFHSEFSAISRQVMIEKIHSHLEKSSNFSKADIVILSLGTAYVYEEIESRRIVNNCHKFPSKKFKRRLLSQEEVVSNLSDCVSIVRRGNPLAKIIATVSPVRHLRDGMVDNTRSKARLHLALAELNEIEYFPSYELLIDDLRDYRFYSKDLIHPSEEAVSYIMDFFTRQFLKAQDEGKRRKILQIRNDLAHRSFFPESSENQLFLQKVIMKMEEMEDEEIDFSMEIASVKARLK